MPKYLLLKHYRGAPEQYRPVPPMDQWAPEDVDAHMAFLHEVSRMLQEKGEYVDAQALTPAQTWVRYGGPGAAPVVTEPPRVPTQSLQASPTTTVAAQATAAPAATGKGAIAVAEARKQLGKPYVYGGAGPNSFDCSGLTAWAWRAAGVSLSHSAYDQWFETTRVPINAPSTHPMTTPARPIASAHFR